MKKLFFLSFLFLITIATTIQAQQPVKWNFEAQKIGDKEYEVIATATIQEGWAVYSQEMDGDSGPIPTQIDLEGGNIKTIGSIVEIGKKKKEYDSMFDMEIVKLSGRTIFKQKIKVDGNTDEVSGVVTFMTCCESSCMPPSEIAFAVALD